jgi:hypothetical protein
MKAALTSILLSIGVFCAAYYALHRYRATQSQPCLTLSDAEHEWRQAGHP